MSFELAHEVGDDVDGCTRSRGARRLAGPERLVLGSTELLGSLPIGDTPAMTLAQNALPPR